MSLFVPPEIWEMILDSRQKNLQIQQLTADIERIKEEFKIDKCDICKRYREGRYNPNANFCEHVPNHIVCYDCVFDSCDLCERNFCELCTSQLYEYPCSVCGEVEIICCQPCSEKDDKICVYCL